MAFRFPVEAGHILMFARAVGDSNPAHTDVENPKELVAPPTFPIASAQFDPDYFLRPKPGQPWIGSGKEPTQLKSSGGGSGGGGGGMARVLHAEQHFEYHRPVKPGDVFTVETKEGQTWEKEGRRGGKLHFSESVTEFRDAAGELVVTARSVGVRTEKAPQ